MHNVSPHVPPAATNTAPFHSSGPSKPDSSTTALPAKYGSRGQSTRDLTSIGSPTPEYAAAQRTQAAFLTLTMVVNSERAGAAVVFDCPG